MKRLAKAIFESNRTSEIMSSYAHNAMLCAHLYLKAGKPSETKHSEIFRELRLKSLQLIKSDSNSKYDSGHFDYLVKEYAERIEGYSGIIITRLYKNIDVLADYYVRNGHRWVEETKPIKKEANVLGEKLNLSKQDILIIFDQTWQILEDSGTSDTRYIQSATLKKAVLSKLGLSESQIVNKGQHSHIANYSPTFIDDTNGVEIQFSIGKAKNFEDGGTWTSYSGFASAKKDGGRYKVALNWTKHENSYEANVLSERDLIPYQGFATYEEARAKLLNYFGL